MPTSARIILTDVDGVLLEWERHFTKWMQLRSYFDEHGIRNYPYKLVDTGQDDYDQARDQGVQQECMDGHTETNVGITDMGKAVTCRGVDLRANNITDLR